MIEETWDSRGFGTFGRRLTFDMPVHHTGTLSYSASFCGAGCSGSSFLHNCVELLDDTGRVLHHNALGGYDAVMSDSVEVVGGRVYQLSLGVCSGPYAGATIEYYVVQVQRPV